MSARLHAKAFIAIGVITAWCFPAAAQSPSGPIPGPPPQTTSAPPTPPPASSENAAENPSSPGSGHAKKLVLKDGSTEIVRSYTVEADRVRYYSAERAQWEEIPVSMVDWDATHKQEASEAAAQAALLATVKSHDREQAARAVRDEVNASYEVAPGVFLPDEEGFFLLQGGGLTKLSEATAVLKNDKGKTIEKMIVPMPSLVATRQNLQLQGANAAIRVHSPQPEFFLNFPVQPEPRVQLLHARVHGDSRIFESLDTRPDIGATVPDTTNKPVQLQSWEVAKGLYRYTIADPLAPGEYVVTLLPEGGNELNVTVWDFGVDARAHAASSY